MDSKPPLKYSERPSIPTSQPALSQEHIRPDLGSITHSLAYIDIESKDMKPLKQLFVLVAVLSIAQAAPGIRSSYVHEDTGESFEF
jgi:hypothetical protein